MPFDKSIRLLNFCTEATNRLKLYTSLPHDYVVGDTVYIIGGHYDNTNFLINISSFVGSTTYLFSNQLNGYKVLFVDYTENIVVLDIIVDVNELVYPYGTVDNPYGDPQNLIDLAYNTFDNDDLYKHVYISRAVFSTGTFRQGIINNGVFGNDKNTVNLNRQISSIDSQCVINHIVSKNVLMSSGIIFSKTDNDISPCLAIKIVEDATVGSPNPFYLYYENIGSNNNGFGFNMFDSFIVTDNATIDNGVFDNPIGININNCTFTGGYIGSNGPIYELILNGNVNMSNVNLHSTTLLTTKVEITDSQIDTSLPLRAISFAYTVNESEFILTVDYDVVANKKWEINSIYFIQGFNYLDNDTYFPLNQKETYAKLLNVSYTFGDVNTATMKFITDIEAIIQWTDMISNYPAANIICSDVILYPRLGTNPKNMVSNTLVSNSNIRSLFEGVLGEFAIKNSIITGIYSGIIFDGTCSLNGNNAGLNTRLLGFVQTHDIITEAAPALDANYVTLEYDSRLKANLINSEIRAGWIYDSYLQNTRVYNFEKCYLNNVILKEGSKVDTGVFWNDTQIDFFTATELGGSSGFDLIETAYLGDRKTPWITSFAGIAPIDSSQGAININKIEGNRAAGYYTSQAIIQPVTLFPTDVTVTSYEVPTLYNVVPTIITNKQIAILDYKAMIFNGSIWESVLGKPRIIYGSQILNNVTIQTALQNKFTNTLSGLFIPGVNPTIATASQITSVDENFIAGGEIYSYSAEARTQREMCIYVKDLIPPISNAVPNPANNDPNVLFFAKVRPNIGPSVDNITTGSITAIPNGINKLKFRHNGIFAAIVGNATTVPACFVEIERVIITEKDLLNVITNRNIVISNYCVPSPSALNDIRYSFDTAVALNTYPTDFFIKDNFGFDITIDINATKKIDVTIEYWITWYYNSATYAVTNLGNANLLTGRSGGVRTKHTLDLKFESNNETYYLITATGNNRITSSNNDPLVYQSL